LAKRFAELIDIERSVTLSLAKWVIERSRINFVRFTSINSA